MDDLLFKMKNINMSIGRVILHFSDHNSIPPSPTQVQIMNYIIDHQGNIIYQKDLELVLGLSRATISGVLITMEKNNIIIRTTSEVDARWKQIELNEEFKNNFLTAKPKLDELSNALKEGVSKEEREIFEKVLEKIENNLIKYENNK